MSDEDIELPPLPKASKMYDIPGYDEEELKDYARAAVLADRQQRGGDVAAVLRLFLTGDGFIAECDIPHIVHALAARPAASDEHLIETGCYQTVIDRHSQPAASAEPVAQIYRKGFQHGSIVWTASGLAADLPDGTNLYAAPVAAQKADDARDTDANLAALQAEVEALRAEVEEWKDVARCASEQQDSLFREALALNKRADRLADALRDAATSMQTIADKAGRDEYLMTTDEVRGYANSRANAARAALKQEAGRG